MLDAYKASFEFYVLASSVDDASKQVRAWRPLALAAGFDPGTGSVKKASDRELQSLESLNQSLRAGRQRLAATEKQRGQATRGLAKHMDGDLEGAEELVASIERASGPLQATVAMALAALGGS